MKNFYNVKDFYNGLRTPITDSVCDVDSRRTARMMACASEMLELLKSMATAMHLDLMNYDDTDRRQVYDYDKNIKALLTKILEGGE